jgi:hypothetical protein
MSRARVLSGADGGRHAPAVRRGLGGYAGTPPTSARGAASPATKPSGPAVWSAAKPPQCRVVLPRPLVALAPPRGLLAPVDEDGVPVIGGPDDAVGAASPVRELGGRGIPVGRRQRQLAQHACIAEGHRRPVGARRIDASTYAKVLPIPSSD